MRYFKVIPFCISVFCVISLSGEPDDKDKDVYFGEIEVISEIENIDEVGWLLESFENEIVNNESYERLTKGILQIALNGGYYFPSLTLDGLKPEESGNLIYINPKFQMYWGYRAVIDTMIFEGLQRTSDKLLQRELIGIKGKIFNQKLDKIVNKSINRYDFLQLTDRSEIVKTKENDYGLLIKIKETAENEFGGVIGYVPPKESLEGYFTGMVDLKLQNLSGTGRQLSVYWSKVNRYSQQLKLRYFEPWIWRTNLYGEAEFQQVLRDTMTVIRSYGLGFGKRMYSYGTIQINLRGESSIPTPGGRKTLGLIPTNVKMVGVEFKRDSRDHARNPGKGLLFNLENRVGYRVTGGNAKDWQYICEFNSDFNYPIVPEWIVNYAMHLNGKWSSKESVSFSEQYWFGGANSLRGYPQDFFRGDVIGWMSFELRWIIGNLSRIYIFTDLGYYQIPDSHNIERNFPGSYGLGIKLESRMGIIGLDYGIGKGDSFSTAKIHLHIENRF